MTRKLAAALVLVLIAAACGDATSPSFAANEAPRPEPAAAPSDAGTQPGSEPAATAGEQPPTATEPVSAADRDFLFAAEEQLVQACMRELGFDYVAAPVPAGVRPSSSSGWATDLERARTEGYGFPALVAAEESGSAAGDDRSAAVDPNAALLAAMSDGELAAWLGALEGTGETTREETGELGGVVEVATDGCRPQANASIYGDLAAWDSARRLLDGIEREAFGRVAADERLLAAVSGWEACMAGRGFAYSDPEQPQEDAYVGYLQGSDREAARLREIEIATADAECVAESRVADLYDELLAEYRAEAQERRGAELIAIHELEAAAVARAKELLRGS